MINNIKLLKYLEIIFLLENLKMKCSQYIILNLKKHSNTYIQKKKIEKLNNIYTCLYTLTIR